MKAFLIALLFVFTFSGCATIRGLYEGEFKDAAQCKAAADEEITELNLSIKDSEALRSEIYRACDKNNEIMKTREDIRDFLKVFKVFL